MLESAAWGSHFPRCGCPPPAPHFSSALGSSRVRPSGLEKDEGFSRKGPQMGLDLLFCSPFRPLTGIFPPLRHKGARQGSCPPSPEMEEAKMTEMTSPESLVLRTAGWEGGGHQTWRNAAPRWPGPGHPLAFGCGSRWHPRAVAMGLPWFLCLLLPWREEEEAANRGMMPGPPARPPDPAPRSWGGSLVRFLALLEGGSGAAFPGNPKSLLKSAAGSSPGCGSSLLPRGWVG